MGCGPSKEEKPDEPIVEKRPPPPPPTREELLARFKLYDNDKSNFIEMGELPDVLRSLDFPVTDARCREIMAKYDANGDGKLSFEEFVKLVQEEELPEREDDAGRLEDAREMFKLFDKDGSGFITRDELKAALMKGSGEDGGMTEAEVDAMFDGFDDGDGKLTCEEFCEMMVHGYERQEEPQLEHVEGGDGVTKLASDADMPGDSAPPATNVLAVEDA